MVAFFLKKKRQVILFNRLLIISVIFLKFKIGKYYLFSKNYNDLLPDRFHSYTVVGAYSNAPVIRDMGKRKYTKISKPYKKEYTSSYSMAPSSAAIKVLVKKELAKQADVKHVTNVVTTLPTAGAILLLTSIQQGISDITRIGDKIKLFSILIQGHVSPSAATQERIQGRIAMVIDHQNAGEAPAITDIWLSVARFAQNGVRLGDTFRHKRFTVIYDHYVAQSAYSLNVAGNGFCTYPEEIKKGYIKQKTEVQFKGAAATEAAADKGSVWLMTAGLSLAVTAEIDIMLKYTDI